MPIAQEVHNALFEGKSVQRCLIDLLARESKDELADYDRWVEQLGAPGRRRLPAGRGGPLLDSITRRGVAQSGSAPVWGTGGRRFKSGRPDQHPRRNRPSGRFLRVWWYQYGQVLGRGDLGRTMVAPL